MNTMAALVSYTTVLHSRYMDVVTRYVLISNSDDKFENIVNLKT